MKKYLPIILFILGFTGFLVTQLGFEKSEKIKMFSRAPSSVAKKFEENFKTLKLKTLDNQEINLSNVNIPIIILNFWAAWCGPCLEELPSLVSLRKKFSAEEVLILGISSDDENSISELKRVEKQYGINFPIVPDYSGEIFNLFDISSIPSTIIFHNGKIQVINKEPMDFDSIEFIEKIEKLLNKRLALTGQV